MMPATDNSTDTRDRVITLGVEMHSLEEKVDKMAEKVDQLYEIMMQAKGARWVLIASAGLAGGLVSLAAKFLPTAIK